MAFDFDYKKAAKLTIQFLTMGACLAVALPYVCDFLGFSDSFIADLAVKQTPVWSMTFFGTMGALHGVISGVLDNVPFLNKEKKPTDISDEISISAMPPMIGAGKANQVGVASQVAAQSSAIQTEQMAQTQPKTFAMPQINVIHSGKIGEMDKTLERV